ncbi:MAG TPA: DNA primase [Gammaproteobacteria bacterium]|nr:DNA primase [Gammaproteobacteria bacterium]
MHDLAHWRQYLAKRFSLRSIVPGRIPQNFIDDLLNRVDIVDIIDSDLPLKKTGRDYQALCPFHSEKTPSFTVSQEKQFYHCFGCGAHGSALGFLMNHRGLSFVEAIEEAARTVGLEVPHEDGVHAPKIDYSPLYEMLERAQNFFVEQLKTHNDRNRAIDYLKSRGLSGGIAKRFGIGYAPDSWDGLMSALGTDEQAIQHLMQAGLIIENDQQRRYDRFRDRITFPIHDRRGRVVAFGGRVIEKGEPKYLNSPETPVFQKRRELYGLYQVKGSNEDISRILVVEGYMDVVALAQFGVTNAVASLGTATTTAQLETLFKVAPEVIFCYDGDGAGRRAAWRALDTALPLIQEGRQAGFIFIPEGDDPDSFVREHGPDVFTSREPIKPLSEFLIDELAKKTNLSSIDGRARFLDLAEPMVKKIPRGSFRQLLAQRIAEIVDLDPHALAPLAGGNRPHTRLARPTKRRGHPSMVEQALKRLLYNPKLANLVVDYKAISGLTDDHAALLAEVLELISRHPNLTTGALVEHYRNSSHYAILEQQLETPLELDDEANAIEFTQAIESLLRKTKPGAFERAKAEMRRRADEVD